MNLYHYKKNTGEFVGKGSARPSPLEPDKFLLPANATDQEPPITRDSEVATWDGLSWEIQPDFRGQTFYEKTTKEKVIIDQIGQPPGTLTDLTPREHDTWSGEDWAHSPTLEQEADKLRASEELSETDIDMARVMEDFLDHVFSSGELPTIDDLPEAVKDKLLNRKALRAKLNT